MAITVECRRCEKKFRAKEEYAGRKTRCPVCHEVLLIGHPIGRQPADAPKAASNGHKGQGHRQVLPHDGSPSYQAHRLDHPVAIAGPARVATADESMATGGSKDDSPLSSEQLEVLKETERYRRPIRHAAIWFRIQFLGALIGTVILVFVSFGVAAADGQVLTGLLMALIIGAVQLAFVVLFHRAYRTTWACRRWAPMTMFILNMLGVGGWLFNGLVAMAINRKEAGPMMMAAIFMAVVPAIIAVISYRAWAAIPRFLNQPAWSQHALTYCGL